MTEWYIFGWAFIFMLFLIVVIEYLVNWRRK